MKKSTKSKQKSKLEGKQKLEKADSPSKEKEHNVAQPDLSDGGGLFDTKKKTKKSAASADDQIKIGAIEAPGLAPLFDEAAVPVQTSKSVTIPDLKPPMVGPNRPMPEDLAKQAGKYGTLTGSSVLDLGPIADTKLIKMIIETPRNSRNKYDYNEASGLFELKSVLPAGMSFPFDFGFIPRTKAEDGDPLDVMILMDEPGFPGILVHTRVVGVLEANQTARSGNKVRNDRIIGVHVKSMLFSHIHTITDIPKELLKQLEYFFIAYNGGRGKKFEPIGWFEPERAYKAIQETMKNYEK